MKLRQEGGQVYLRDFSFETIAEEYGTPFYLYDLETMKGKISLIRKAFGNSLELYYAVKANPNVEILKALRDHVDGLDIASAGELEQSLLAGYNPGQISFAGPGKTVQELQSAIEHNIGILSVESQRELHDIRNISAQKKVKVPIVLRVNPSLLIKEFAIKMGGKASQFGIDEEEVPGALQLIKKNQDHFDLLGIHIYAGTQCLNEEALAKNISNTLRITEDLYNNYGVVCRIINLGGGFGVSYYETEKEINLNTLADLVIPDLDRVRRSTNSHPRFILELGRYLVAEAGIYVARIISEKTSRGEKFYVLDGGMNHNLAASGNLGTVIRKNYLARNLSNTTADMETCNLVGPLCTPLDLMGNKIKIESPKVGDLVGILNSGSYGFTASPLLFLGHETPVELLAGNGALECIRKMADLTVFN